MKLISFALTTQAILDQTKTVTRRLGWKALKPGAVLQPVRKCMGFKKGEHPEHIGCPIRVTSVRQECLEEMEWLEHYGRRECYSEGFPGRTGKWFVRHFAKAMKCQPGAMVTRIEFEYLQPKSP